jgi:hypothetical protein
MDMGMEEEVCVRRVVSSTCGPSNDCDAPGILPGG